MAAVVSCVAEFEFGDACALRLCCRELSRHSRLCASVARHHLLFPALVAQPKTGTRIVGDGYELLQAVVALRSQFEDATSLTAFSAAEESLGEGPLSEVSLHRHRASQVYVAIKSYSKESLVKFKKVEEAMQEREAMRALRHPLIVRLFATFQSTQNLHFALELCPFGDLVDVVRRRPEKRLPLRECETIVRQLVQVLQYVHSQGFWHRDVKCENILMGSDGLIRLTDFATAHKAGQECKVPFVGSPQYMAPEIIRGGAPSEKIDIFGAGCVAYFIWTGEHAFLCETDFLTWKCILEEPIQLPHVIGEGDEHYRAFVEVAVDKDAEKRHFSVI